MSANDNYEAENVVYLPSVGRVMPAAEAAEHGELARRESAGDIEHVGEVLEGELLDEAASAEVEARLQLQRLTRLRQRSASSAVELAHRAGTYARTHAPTRQQVGQATSVSGHFLARHLYLVMQGHSSWYHRAWAALTHEPVRAQIRAARASGDVDALQDWIERLDKEKELRLKRIQALPATVWSALKAVALGILVLAAVLALIGLGVHLGVYGATFADWWHGLAQLGTGAAAVFAVLLKVSVVGIPLAWLIGAWREGKRTATPPRWAAVPGAEDEDVIIDERTISQALAHLGIAPLNAYLKAGGEIRYITPARTDGDGTYAQIRLPMGVTAEMVADKRNVLAANLGRAPLETWPTQGDEAGILDLWVADKGTLSGGAGPWPLLDEGQVDLFAGVPFGLTQRGQLVNAPLFEANWLVGGRPGQGKTSALRTLLLGAALDPTAELWVFVMGQSPDFEPFRPRLTRYEMGLDDTVAEAALRALEDLLMEMERRGKVLGRQPGKPPKVSRKLADKPQLGLHPLVCAMDEVHELFQHPTYGKKAAELAVRLIKRGRKYGIILLFATQSPTKDSIPKEITRNVSRGVAFSVGDYVANDGLLGSGKYKAGIRATELRMKTDRGTCVAVGTTDATFELVRAFYVPFEDGLDLVTPVIARAMHDIAEAGRTVSADDAEPVAPVDHLANIAHVMRDEKRVRTQVVLSRLAEHDHGEYEGWSPHTLAAVLAENGIEIRKSQGNRVIRAEDVADAIADRDDEFEAETSEPEDWR